MPRNGGRSSRSSGSGRNEDVLAQWPALLLSGGPPRDLACRAAALQFHTAHAAYPRPPPSMPEQDLSLRMNDSMKWQVGRVTITQLIEIETVGGKEYILPQATPEALREIEWLRPRFADLALEIFPREQQTPEALGALQKADAEKWWPIIKEAGITAE